MNRGSSFFVRCVTFLVGFILAGVGAVLILWYAGVKPIAGALHDHWPKDQLAQAPEQSWWIGALFGIAIAGIILALINISVLARRRTVDTLYVDENDPAGRISLEVSDIAKAISADLETVPYIRDASCRAVNDNGITCIDSHIVAAAEAPIADLLSICDQVAQDVPAAVGYSGATARAFLNFDKPRPENKGSGVVTPQNLTPVQASAHEPARVTDTSV